MNKIIELIRKYIKKGGGLPDTEVEKIRYTFNTEGWKIIEEYIKNLISEYYSDLLIIGKEELENKQTMIGTLLDLLHKIYNLAGYSWMWDEYKDVKNLKIEQDEYQNKLDEIKKEYLDEIRPN